MEVIGKQDIQVILSRLLTPCLHAVISFSPSSFILIEQKCRNSHSVSGFCDWSTGEDGLRQGCQLYKLFIFIPDHKAIKPDTKARRCRKRKEISFSRYPLILCALCVSAPLHWIFITQTLLHIRWKQGNLALNSHRIWRTTEHLNIKRYRYNCCKIRNGTHSRLSKSVILLIFALPGLWHPESLKKNRLEHTDK